jgi:hypothetical protein
MEVHTCNPNSQEDGELKTNLGIHGETLSQKKKKNQSQKEKKTDSTN